PRTPDYLTSFPARRSSDPNPGYFGPDSFTFKANDGSLDSNVATVSITVQHVNHAPVASDGALATDQDTAKDVTLQATDPDGDPLTFTIVTGPSHGTRPEHRRVGTYSTPPRYT